MREDEDGYPVPESMAARQVRESREGLYTANRVRELRLFPVKGQFDATHLKEVHRRIFQDLPHHAPGAYRPKAGGYSKTRTLETSGASHRVFYAQRSDVDAGVDRTLAAFGGPDSLRGLNADQFSTRMAKLYGYLDHLHPFKEGNSRTLRAFTEQLAQEAGVNLNWAATNADGRSRDRLYIARDMEVIRRTFPGIEKGYPAEVITSDEHAATVVLSMYKNAPTLQEIIKASAYRAEDIRAAKAFREQTNAEVLKKYPDLAGSYATLVAIEKKAEADGIAGQQRSVVVDRARENIALLIERGGRPVQTITQQQARDKDADREAPGR